MSLPDTWKIMEDLQKEGLTRSIGVSNFREEDLMAMEPYWTIPPTVNQVSPLLRPH
jgi:diketogulonate reductase-like aldo/keto reductase